MLRKLMPRSETFFDAFDTQCAVTVEGTKVQEVVATLRLMKKPERILEGCQAIKRLETQADEVLRSGMGRLFKSGMDPLTLIKWKEIYDLIETATDKCLDAADVIEGVVLEHA